MNEPVTLRLDASTRKRLDQIAKTVRRNRAALAAEAVRQFVELNERQIAAIQEGINQADSGQFIEHAILKGEWEKKNRGGRRGYRGWAIADYGAGICGGHEAASQARRQSKKSGLSIIDVNFFA